LIPEVHATAMPHSFLIHSRTWKSDLSPIKIPDEGKHIFCVLIFLCVHALFNSLVEQQRGRDKEAL
ncbi:hypothetical protein ACQP3J_31115, partial [Escherichia coli]